MDDCTRRLAVTGCQVSLLGCGILHSAVRVTRTTPLLNLHPWRGRIRNTEFCQSAAMNIFDVYEIPVLSVLSCKRG
jgi:hypothetical protein